jgi:hypothetical protein
VPDPAPAAVGTAGPTLAAGATGAAGGGVAGGPSCTGGAGAAPVTGGGAMGAWPLPLVGPDVDAVWPAGGAEGASGVGESADGGAADATVIGADG